MKYLRIGAQWLIIPLVNFIWLLYPVHTVNSPRCCVYEVISVVVLQVLYTKWKFLISVVYFSDLTYSKKAIQHFDNAVVSCSVSKAVNTTVTPGLCILIACCWIDNYLPKHIDHQRSWVHQILLEPLNCSLIWY